MMDEPLFSVLQKHPELFSEHVDLEAELDRIKAVVLINSGMEH